MATAVAVCVVAIFAVLVLILVVPTRSSSGHRLTANQGHPAHPTTVAPTDPSTTTTATTAPPAPSWQVAWGSAMAWGYGTVTHATVRSLALVPVDASDVKVRVSNRFGNAPLTVASATVAQSGGGATLVAGSLVPLRFGGSPAVTIPVGTSVVSDPVAFPVTASETLAVSMYVSGTNLITSHYPCCEAQTPSYVSAPGSGDLAGSASPLGFEFAAPFSRLLDAVDVVRPPAPAGVPAARGSIVVVGDSITDGFNSTGRWTNVLQQRIATLPVAERPAVINEGITANALTAVVPSDALTGGGPPGLLRLMPDALDQPGVATVVLFLGTNDLFFGAPASAVIAGMQQAATMAHQAGIRIVGVTLLPRLGGERWDLARVAALDQINQWLLTTNVFDGVINLATPVADMYNGGCDPAILLPAYNSGDSTHPNIAGDTAMADAVAPQVLGLPALPQVPPLLAAVPTPGCRGAPGIPAPGTPQPSQ